MVSIIIPIFNAERFLKQCFDSCIRQTFTDLEILLVNDASTDGSKKVCESYCKQDKRFKLIDNYKNQGVEKSRFDALSVAKGDYVTFLDADDWLCDKNIIKKAVSNAKEHNVDYVEFGMQKVIDKWGIIKQSHWIKNDVLITQPELFEKYYITFFGKFLITSFMCGKVYRKSIFNTTDLSPLGLGMCEDHAFNLRLFPHLSRVYIMKDIGYCYRWGGMTSRYNPHFYPNCKALYLLREKLIQKYSYYKAIDYLKIESRNVLITQIAMMITFRKGSKAEIIDWITHELKDEMYQRVCTLTQEETKKSMQHPAMIAIRNKDSEELYRLGENEWKNGRRKRMLKKILFKIANIFR